MKRDCALIALFEIFILLISIISFGFFLSIDIVSAPTPAPENPEYSKTYLQTPSKNLPIINTIGDKTKKEELGPQSWLPKLLGVPQTGGGDTFLAGAQWAGIAYGAGQLIGYVFGLEKETTTALSASLAAG